MAELKDVFATICLVLWTIQLLPQLWHSYRRKSTHGLSLALIFIWTFAGMLLACYSCILYILRSIDGERISVLLVVQPHIFYTLCLLCLMQDYLYSGFKSGFLDYLNRKLLHRQISTDEPVSVDDSDKEATKTDDAISSPTEQVSLMKCLAIFSGLFVAIVLLQLGLVSLGVFVEQVYFPAIVAISSSILTLIGFVPQYLEVIRLKSTQGLSLTFVSLDCLGAVAGCLSLIVAGLGSIDWFALGIYLSVFVGDFVLVVFKLCIFRTSG